MAARLPELPSEYSLESIPKKKISDQNTISVSNSIPYLKMDTLLPAFSETGLLLWLYAF